MTGRRSFAVRPARWGALGAAFAAALAAWGAGAGRVAATPPPQARAPAERFPGSAAGAADAAAIPSLFEQELARFARLAGSGVPECQVEAAQGLYYLAHRRGEEVLLPLAGSADPPVRLEAVKALGVCGGRRSVEALVDRLDDGDWEIRANARDALCLMTAAGPFADARTARAWLDRSSWQQKEAELIGRLSDGDKAKALAALKALRFVGSSAAEEEVLRRGPALGHPSWTVLALERIGTDKSLPLLLSKVPQLPAACWAAAEIGGPRAEDALLQALARWRQTRLDAMVNLDRIGSTRCGPHLPALLDAFGLVIFRSQTDDLQFAPTAGQRLAANLILRTGRSQQAVDLILAECEGRRDDAKTPPALREVLANMRPELKAGFVRGDGQTVAQPLAAVPHIIRDRAFVPRLIALLEHPAFLVRVYAAEALAALKAPEAVGPILGIVRTAYEFPDATTQVSGKHFDRSRSVRWRGYLCIALGKLGGQQARQGLEALAGDADAYRDVRYGSVVGLRFLCSPESLPVLRRAAEQDIIREIRLEAQAAIGEIELAGRLAASGAGPSRPAAGPNPSE